MNTKPILAVALLLTAACTVTEVESRGHARAHTEMLAMKKRVDHIQSATERAKANEKGIEALRTRLDDALGRIEQHSHAQLKNEIKDVHQSIHASMQRVEGRVKALEAANRSSVAAKQASAARSNKSSRGSRTVSGSSQARKVRADIARALGRVRALEQRVNKLLRETHAARGSVAAANEAKRAAERLRADFSRRIASEAARRAALELPRPSRTVRSASAKVAPRRAAVRQPMPPRTIALPKLPAPRSKRPEVHIKIDNRDGDVIINLGTGSRPKIDVTEKGKSRTVWPQPVKKAKAKPKRAKKTKSTKKKQDRRGRIHENG